MLFQASFFTRARVTCAVQSSTEGCKDRGVIPGPQFSVLNKGFKDSSVLLERTNWFPELLSFNSSCELLSSPRRRELRSYC
jgi:hypothetical protein